MKKHRFFAWMTGICFSTKMTGPLQRKCHGILIQFFQNIDKGDRLGLADRGSDAQNDQDNVRSMVNDWIAESGL